MGAHNGECHKTILCKKITPYFCASFLSSFIGLSYERPYLVLDLNLMEKLHVNRHLTSVNHRLTSVNCQLTCQVAVYNCKPLAVYTCQAAVYNCKLPAVYTCQVVVYNCKLLVYTCKLAVYSVNWQFTLANHLKCIFTSILLITLLDTGGNTFLVFHKERPYLVLDLNLILKVACDLL